MSGIFGALSPATNSAGSNSVRQPLCHRYLLMLGRNSHGQNNILSQVSMVPNKSSIRDICSKKLKARNESAMMRGCNVGARERVGVFADRSQSRWNRKL